MTHLKGMLVAGCWLKLAQDWFMSSRVHFDSGGHSEWQFSAERKRTSAFLEVRRLRTFVPQVKKDRYT